MRRIAIGLNDDMYSDYLMDSSLMKGYAEELFFCHTTEEVKQLVRACYKDNIPMTIQGAMTGICGGAVPEGGCIINMSEMNEILGMSFNSETGEYCLQVQPGLLLKDLNDVLRSKKINTSLWSEETIGIYERFRQSNAKLFPPDPTESLASIGGMVACDASGACSFKYGSTRRYVECIKMVAMIEGDVQEVTINRGQYSYKELHQLFPHNSLLPSWHVHNENLKDVAGLYYDDDMDLIDLFIGGEGLFGIITEVSLRVIDAPLIKMGLMLFLEKHHMLADFIQWLRSDELLEKPCAIEYFDRNTFDLLNEFRDIKPVIRQLPALSESYHGGLYLEFHLRDENHLDEVMVQLFEQLNGYGISEEEQWLALEPSDYEKLKNFRHSVPECVNILVANQKISDSNINKVGTDMAVPNQMLDDVLSMYHSDIKSNRVRSCIFGHIGDSHLHVNVIPKNTHEYDIALDLVNSWAKQVVVWGGTVTAEHGIGKLKKELLKQMMSDRDLESMKTIKNIIEPRGLINQGTLLD